MLSVGYIEVFLYAMNSALDLKEAMKTKRVT